PSFTVSLHDALPICLHQLLEFSNLVTNVHSLYMKPRVVLGRVHVEGHREVEGDALDALDALRPRVHDGARPGVAGELGELREDLSREDDGRPLRPLEDRLDGPADDRLALELKEELLPPHAAGESGGQHDARDHARSGEARRRSRRAGGAFGRGWTRPVPAASHADLTHPGGAQPPRGMRAHAAW